MSRSQLQRETGWGTPRAARVWKSALNYSISMLNFPVGERSGSGTEVGPPELQETGGSTGVYGREPVGQSDGNRTPIQEEEVKKKKTTTTEKQQRTRVFPPGCNPELVDAFWKVKKGSKSDQAWALLVTNLFKIHGAGGDVNDQLQQGENAKWFGVSFKNWQQFAGPNGNGPAQPAWKSRPTAAEERTQRNKQFLDKRYGEQGEETGRDRDTEPDIPF